MRVIKLAFISFIVFFIILTSISLLIPSRIRISKAINIMAQPDRVLSLVKDTIAWKHWHPQFSTQHASPNLIIKPLRQNDSEVVFQMDRLNRSALINGWQVHRYPFTDSLTLQWYIDFKLRWYPWQKFSSLFYEAAYGTMMQQGLTNIKNKVEK